MKIDIKTNSISVQSNLRGATHGNLGLFMTDVKYATLSNVLYVRTMSPGILIMPNNYTQFASYKLKQVYDENLQEFHEVRRFEQALLQHIITTVGEHYITSMKNRATAQFTVIIPQIFSYLLTTYGNFSPIQLNNFKN